MKKSAFLFFCLIITFIGTNSPASARHGHGRHGGMHNAAAGSPYFAESDNCSFCHNGLRDASGKDVSIQRNWQASMMANSATDPLWQAKVHSEVLRNPQLKEIIEKRCSRCHMPMANEQARIRGTGSSIFEEGFLGPSNPYHALARDGVSCTLCHQIQDKDLGTRAGFSGNFQIDDRARRPFRSLEGPYTYPFQMPMRMMSGFTPSYGGQMGRSELCATCHTVYVPFVDASGNIAGEMPEQTPYAEWRYSSFGDGLNGDDKSCQNCHMPEASGGVRISTMPHRLSGREPFGRHTFSGANVFMLRLLRKFSDELGIDAAAELEAGMARIEEMLRTQTADIRLEQIRRTGDTAEIEVRVINKTGHKFPTGIPLRRAWVHLVVLNREGTAIFESGRPNDEGAVEGNDADRDLLTYEPHYDIIDTPEKVQIYEALEGDTDKMLTYVFLKGAEHLKDNRLLPSGFDKLTAPADICPHTEAVVDPDFTGGSDLVTYIVKIPKDSGPLTVRAELLYQTVSFAFVKDLSGLTGQSPYTERFGRYYKGLRDRHTLISSAEASIVP